MKRSITLIFFVCCLFFSPFASMAQEVTVTGRVTEKADGKPLPGVTVTIQGTSKATSTDANGKYAITVATGTKLEFRQLGMKPQTITVSGTVVNVALESDETALSEIVVIGYGTQKKSLVTGAISSIKAEDLKTVSSGRIDQALQGRTAGVNVIPNSGAPGAGMSIRVRGAGSNRKSDPLYIVDGVRAGGIEFLDPSEVSNIEILKDAASAAIYGAEGANGVVIITTKSGKANSSVINYTFQYGIQSARNNVKPMDPLQYQQYLAEAKLSGPTLEQAKAVGAGTNWADEVFDTAPLQHHTLNFSGGSDKSTYLIGMNYFTQKGIIGSDKSKFDRVTIRINSDHKMKSWLNIGERLSYSNFTNRGISENTEYGSVVGSMLAYDPLTPVTYTGELPTHVKNALASNFPLVKDGNGNYYGISPYVQGEYGNPLAMIATTNSRTNQNKLVGNVFADVEPIAGLKFTTRFGIDAAFVRNHAWNPTSWYSSEKTTPIANGSDYQRNYFNWQWENYITYNKKIGDHNFSVLAGTSAIKRMYNNIEGSYSGIFRNEEKWAYPEYVLEAKEKLSTFTGRYDASTLQSYYGRLMYDYKDKYLFAATLRYDGSSLFPSDRRWGTFPSVSAGWVMSKEDFYSSNISDVVNYAKLRGSWGQNGSLSNVPIGSWQSFVSQGQKYTDAEGNFVLGASPTNLLNPFLTWETSEQLDFGLDLSLFNSRVTFTADYFKKTTKDLITNGAAPYIAGNGLNDVNSGNVVNKGWEFELAYNNGAQSAFKYEIALNLSALNNKVTKTNPLYPIITGAGVGTGWSATRFEKDLPLWYFYGYKTDGVFQNQGEIDKYIADNKLTGYAPKPGDPRFVDVNKDGAIGPTDQTNIGNAFPDFTYGARISMSYKGFDFLAFLQGSQGNDVLMGFIRNDRRTANKPDFFFKDRWNGDGSTNTFFSAGADAKSYNSDMMIFDGSFAKIRQLQLGYTLPNSFTNKISVQNVRLYFSLDDYFTFTKYKGLDPEGGNAGGNSIGIDRGVYPTPKKALFGLSFTF
jgi:TonB-linked SusC/RagA family outer membrane protein